MLAHIPDGVEASYNRAAYLPRRREIAQEWADMLLKDMPPAMALLEGPRRQVPLLREAGHEPPAYSRCRMAAQP